MEEKHFSAIVVSFVFVVAIVSAVFMFSGTTNTANVVKSQVYYDGMSPSYANYANNPQPYAALDYWGDAQRGVEKGISEDSTVNYYERNKATQTYFDKPGYEFKPNYMAYEDTYSGQQSGCPVNYRSIECANIRMYQDRGYTVERMGDSCCWKIGESLV